MLRINLLKSASAPAAVDRGAFLSRRETQMGAVLLVAGAVLLFYLASRRTVLLPPAPPAAPNQSQSPPPSLPTGPPAPAPTAKTEPPVKAVQDEPSAPAPGAKTAPAPLPAKTEPPVKAVQAEPSAPAPAAKTTPAPRPPKAEPPVKAAQAAPSAPAPAGPEAPFELTEISLQQQKDALILLALVGPGNLKYQTMKLENPSRLVIDLANCRLKVPSNQRSRPVEHPKVKRVRISQFRLEPPLVRIVLDLEAFPRYQIRPDPQGLEIKVLDGQP